MDCDQIEKEEVIEAYLTGKLDRDRQEEFETHYFGCSKCLEKLQVSRLLQEKLWEKGEAILPKREKPQPVQDRHRAWVVSAAAVMLVVAAAALWWRFGGPGRTPGGIEGVSSSLKLLARFEPPLYVPLTLRGAQDEATERFRMGMGYYQDGRYAEAITELRAAAGLDPGRPGIRFFLGICLLLTEQVDAGTEELKATVALGDSAYLEEAHFYLAKAWLAKGNTRAAKEELNWVWEKGRNLRDEAARILTQLQ